MIIESKPKAYRLIKEYPGSKPLGYIEPYTTGEFSKNGYSVFWEPIFETKSTRYEGKIPVLQPVPKLTWEVIKEYPSGPKLGELVSCLPNDNYKVDFYNSYPQFFFFRKVEPKKILFPTFCGLDVKFDGVSKDHVVIGNTVYSISFFRNIAYLLRSPNIHISFNMHTLTLDYVNDFIKAIEDNN